MSSQTSPHVCFGTEFESSFGVTNTVKILSPLIWNLPRASLLTRSFPTLPKMAHPTKPSFWFPHLMLFSTPQAPSISNSRIPRSCLTLLFIELREFYAQSRIKRLRWSELSLPLHLQLSLAQTDTPTCRFDFLVLRSIILNSRFIRYRP